MTTIRKLVITKKPRSDPIPDKPIDFPPLENLHLELLENKRKLKKGLPLVPVKSKRRPFKPPSRKTDKETDQEQPSHEHRSKKKKHRNKTSDDDADMINELKDEEDSEVEIHTKSDGGSSESEGSDPEEEEENDEEEEEDPYAGMSPEEREAAEKEEYVWRFRILKKKYKSPSVPIPEFNEHSDLVHMKTTYDRTVRELSLDRNVARYQKYLLGGFMLMEYVCTQHMNIDLSGFTAQQSMTDYDLLLVELGERSYNSWGSNLPVEVRLVGLIIFQAGVFYLGKIISSQFGSKVSDLFGGFTGQQDGQSQKPKKKMRGPKIKPDELRKMAGQKESSDSSSGSE